MEPFELPEFRLDPYQEAVLASLHLEFFLARCRVLITPRTTLVQVDRLVDQVREIGDALLSRGMESI